MRERERENYWGGKDKKKRERERGGGGRKMTLHKLAESGSYLKIEHLLTASTTKLTENKTVIQPTTMKYKLYCTYMGYIMYGFNEEMLQYKRIIRKSFVTERERVKESKMILKILCLLLIFDKLCSGLPIGSPNEDKNKIKELGKELDVQSSKGKEMKSQEKDTKWDDENKISQGVRGQDNKAKLESKEKAAIEAKRVKEQKAELEYKQKLAKIQKIKQQKAKLEIKMKIQAEKAQEQKIESERKQKIAQEQGDNEGEGKPEEKMKTQEDATEKKAETEEKDKEETKTQKTVESKVEDAEVAEKAKTSSGRKQKMKAEEAKGKLEISKVKEQTAELERKRKIAQKMEEAEMKRKQQVAEDIRAQKAREEKVELQQKQQIIQEIEGQKLANKQTKEESKLQEEKGTKAQDRCSDEDGGDVVTIPVTMNNVKKPLKNVKAKIM